MEEHWKIGMSQRTLHTQNLSLIVSSYPTMLSQFTLLIFDGVNWDRIFSCLFPVECLEWRWNIVVRFVFKISNEKWIYIEYFSFYLKSKEIRLMCPAFSYICNKKRNFVFGVKAALSGLSFNLECVRQLLTGGFLVLFGKQFLQSIVDDFYICFIH